MKNVPLSERFQNWANTPHRIFIDKYVGSLYKFFLMLLRIGTFFLDHQKNNGFDFFRWRWMQNHNWPTNPPATSLDLWNAHCEQRDAVVYHKFKKSQLGLSIRFRNCKLASNMTSSYKDLVSVSKVVDPMSLSFPANRAPPHSHAMLSGPLLVF
jgi:hypothetical protein